MRFLDYMGVAMGNIRRQKLRSALTIFAVVIGATSTTIMLALVTGAKDFFVSQFEANGQLQQVAVTQATDLSYDQAQHSGGPPSSTGVLLTGALESKIETLPHVVGASATVGVPFDSLLYQGIHLNLTQAIAYEPNAVIQYTVVAGRNLDASDGPGNVTLTTPYADRLGFKGNYRALVGRQITLRTLPGFSGEGATLPPPPNQSSPGGPGQGGGFPNQSAPTDLPATVVGVVAGSGPDDATVYLPLSWAKGLMEQRNWPPTPSQPPCPQFTPPGQPKCVPPISKAPSLITTDRLAQQGYGSIIVKVDGVNTANSVASAIRVFGVGAVTAESYVNQQIAAFNIVGLVLGGIGGIALIVAAIGVVNTMVMAILERTREIGVMRACGATRAMVRRLFTFEAAVLGFLGGAIGLALGYGLTFIANGIINRQLQASAIAVANVITIPAWLILVVLGATTGIGVLAGLGPAARAARLDPVEALRYE